MLHVNQMKEIIDLEETVCLPRYTCNRRSNEVQSIFNPDIAFTDSINQNVSKSFILDHTTLSGICDRGSSQGHSTI